MFFSRFIDTFCSNDILFIADTSEMSSSGVKGGGGDSRRSERT